MPRCLNDPNDIAPRIIAILRGNALSISTLKQLIVTVVNEALSEGFQLADCVANGTQIS